MKINDKVFNFIVGLVFIFIVNLGVSSLSMLFLDLSFRECLIYSLVNALWMPTVIKYIFDKFDFIPFKKNKKNLL